MDSATRAKLVARKARYETQLDTANDTLDTMIADQYSMTELDTNEGDQKLVSRKITDIENLIDRLEAKIDQIDNRLNNRAIVHVRTRRKAGAIRRIY